MLYNGSTERAQRAEASEAVEHMDKIVTLTPRFAATAALAEADFAEAKRLGFKAIVSNRTDGEEPGQLTARQEAVLAWRAGLQFRHVPASKHDLFTDDVVTGMAEALADLNGPVLAHCKSGLRSIIAWAAASARSQSVDCVLDALRVAGQDLEFLRDDLEAQAARRQWLGTAPALDCDCDTRSMDFAAPLRLAAAG